MTARKPQSETTSSTRTAAPKKAPVKRKTKAQVIDHVDIADEVYNTEEYGSSKSAVPMLRNADGRSVELSIPVIQTLGDEVGADIIKLSDAILSKVKIADSGELGQGINEILTLTRRVDVTKLGQQDTGFISRVWNIFGDTKQKVLDQFETSADQIAKISDTLQDGIQRMQGETLWLEDTYNANVTYLKEMESILHNVDEVLAFEDAKMNAMSADENTPLEELQEQDLLLDTLGKQADKLRRLAHMARTSAPQLMSMRKVNNSTINTFNSLQQSVIPLWKQNMGQYLIALQQSKDNELANQINDATNRLLIDNSKNVADNMRSAAKAAQRGIVDLKTIQMVQNNMISGITDTKQIESEGRQKREQAKKELQRMNEELKTALRNVSEDNIKRLRK